MDQYSEKYFAQDHSKTAIANSQNDKNAIQLIDNRPISALQQKLSIIQKKTNSENSKNTLSDERNLQTEENHNPAQLNTETPAVKRNNTIQLARTKQTTRRNTARRDTTKPKIKKTDTYLYNPHREYQEIKLSISKKANAAKFHLENVKPQLEDDEEISLLESYESNVNKIDSKASNILIKIKSLPASKGPLRSQNVARNTLAGELNGYNKYLNILLIEIRNIFPMNVGGFGAKGRAHDIQTDVNPFYAPFGKTLNNHYFQNFTLDGIAPQVNVYKQSAIAPKQKAGPLQILGFSYANSSNPDKLSLQNKVDNSLKAIQTTQDVWFTNTPVGKDRGDGQYKNMANTNAAGYAWLLGLVGNQRWEWLHIRGAGLGGKTDSTNLVAGARDANTHMIPFESNIRHLGTAVKKHSDKYSKLQVIWSVSGQIAKFAYDTIRIQWNLFRNNNTLKAKGDVSFQPLNTNNNISKNEVAKIEDLLSEVRNGLDK
ncbi:hypothetical protein D3C85_389490 [compost metagenome]